MIQTDSTGSSKIVDAGIPINRAHLRAIVLFAPTHDIRYYLNAVLVHVTAAAVRLVATDGRALVIAQTELAEPLDATVRTKILVPIDVAKRFAADKDKTQIFVLPIEGVDRFKMESAALSINFTPVDGSFPDYENRAILPKTLSGEPQQFDPELVTRFGKAASILGPKDLRIMRVEYNGPYGPALVQCGGNADFVGVLMPMKHAPDARGVPPWLHPRSALADMEDASGNLPGVASQEDAQDDKPLNTVGNADAPKRSGKREAKRAAEAAFE